MSPSFLSVPYKAEPLTFGQQRLPTCRKRISGSLKLSPELREDVQSTACGLCPGAPTLEAGQKPSLPQVAQCAAEHLPWHRSGPSEGSKNSISECGDVLRDGSADEHACGDDGIACVPEQATRKISPVLLEDLSWPLEMLQTVEVGVGKRSEVTPHPFAPVRKSRRRALARQVVSGPNSRECLGPLTAGNRLQNSDVTVRPTRNGMVLGIEPSVEVLPVKAVSLDELTWPGYCSQLSEAENANAREKLARTPMVQGGTPCSLKSAQMLSTGGDVALSDAYASAPRLSNQRILKSSGARFGARTALGRMRKLRRGEKNCPSLRGKRPTIRPESTKSRNRFPHVPWALETAIFLREFLTASFCDSGAGKRALRLGTDCAGAEAPIFALHEIRSAINNALGRDLQIEHLFSCDVEPSSRRFIRQNCSPHAFFPDLLARGSISHCIIAERPRIVPSDLDIYVAGFPCKDFSTLNKFRDCLTGPNSPIFYGVVRYIRSHEPCVFILENVSGLANRKHGAPAPIHEVMRVLRDIPGYTVRGWRVNTADYHLPQRRRRVYIVGVHTGKTSLTRPLSAWGELLRQLATKSQPAPALDFVLSDHEPEVQEEASRLKFRRQGHSVGEKWMDKHRAVIERLGLGNTRPYTGQHRGYCPSLCERIRDVVEFTACRVAEVSGCPAEQTQYLAEVSQNPEFALNTVKDNVSPCVTPAGKLWCFSRFRYLVGIEKMALQGFPADSLNLSGLSKAEVEALAGNSMSVSMVGTFLSLVLAFVNFPDK